MSDIFNTVWTVIIVLILVVLLLRLPGAIKAKTVNWLRTVAVFVMCLSQLASKLCGIIMRSRLDMSADPFSLVDSSNMLRSSLDVLTALCILAFLISVAQGKKRHQGM